MRGAMFFNLCKIRPTGFLHTSGFNDVADSLAWSLTSLGHKAGVSENDLLNGDQIVLFGAELLNPQQPLSPNTILYNLEQPSHPNFENIKRLAKGHTIWDYSKANYEQWVAWGYDARHVPIGWTPNLVRIPTDVEKDIDVLFYGWLTQRRVELFNKLEAEGVKTTFCSNIYGGGRDNLIARAKLCLNVHHDGRDMFEVVRVSFLLANGKYVISEHSRDDGEYGDMDAGLVRTSYEEMVPTIKTTLGAGLNPDLAPWRGRDYTATVQRAIVPTPRHLFRYAQASQNGDMKDFVPVLREHAHGRILEIGVRDGASTSAFLSGIDARGGTLFSVDTSDCSGLFTHPAWTFQQADSKTLDFPEASFDTILIDGDHSRAGYISDLNNSWRWIKPGGLIFSHDIAPEPGQTQEDGGGDFPSIAIKEEYYNWCTRTGCLHKEYPGKYGLGMMIKPS
jgi:Methyltransferase domain